MAIPDRDFGHLESSDGRMCGYVDRFGVERDMSGAAIAPGSRPTPGTLGAPIIGVGARGVPVVVAQSAVAASVTGTVAETTLATIAIPAGVMGVNGSLRIRTLWSYTNSANTKNLRVYFGGQVLMQLVPTTTAATHDMRMVNNQGVTNSQIAFGIGANSFGTSGGNNNYTIDTTQVVAIEIKGQLTNTGETITIQSYTVEALNP